MFAEIRKRSHTADEEAATAMTCFSLHLRGPYMVGVSQ